MVKHKTQVLSNVSFLQADDMIQHQSKVVAQHTVDDAIVE